MNSESIKKVTNQAIEQLVEALNAGHSEALTRYLGAIARFRTYSFLNVLLILKACPNASRVAGYKTWQSFGRQVKQGEKGIMILAPMFRKHTDKPEESKITEPTWRIPSGINAVNPAYPRSWNRYAYVQNNPLTLTDPQGPDCIYGSYQNGAIGEYAADSGVYIVPGDCVSDSDNGVYVDGTVTSAYLDSNGDLQYGFNPANCAPGTICTGVGSETGFAGWDWSDPDNSGGNTSIVPPNTWQHTAGCFLRGAAVGAGGALIVGGLAVGAVALGAPAAVVSGTLLVAGGIAGGLTVYSAGTNLANGNYAAAAYDVGSIAGGAAAGGAIGGRVGDAINAPATRGFSISRAISQGYKSGMGSVKQWLGTGPDAQAAAGATAAAGSGARILSFLRGGC
jgi:hypothetical protein